MTKRILVNWIHPLISRLFILLSCSSYEVAICYLSWKQFFPGQRKWYEAAFSFSPAWSQDKRVQKLTTECRTQSPNRDRCVQAHDQNWGAEVFPRLHMSCCLRRRSGLPFYCQNRREIWWIIFHKVYYLAFWLGENSCEAHNFYSFQLLFGVMGPHWVSRSPSSPLS